MRWIFLLLAFCCAAKAQEDVALVGNAFVPDEIPGLRCNLDAYQFRNLTNGASVGAWVCEKTRILVTNAVSSSRPTYQVINGVGFLRFDGVDDSLTQPEGDAYPSGDTNRIHSFCTSIIGRTSVGKGADGGHGEGWSFFVKYPDLPNNYSSLGMVIGSGTLYYPHINLNTNISRSFIFVDSGNFISWYENGTNVYSTNTSVLQYRSSTIGLMLGRTATFSVYQYSQIPQILIYRSTLSYSELRRINEYLSTRHRIPNVYRGL